MSHEKKNSGANYDMTAEQLASNAWYAFAFLKILVTVQQGCEPIFDEEEDFSALPDERKAQILQLLTDEGAIERIDFRWQVTEHGFDLHDKMSKVRRKEVRRKAFLELLGEDDLSLCPGPSYVMYALGDEE